LLLPDRVRLRARAPSQSGMRLSRSASTELAEVFALPQPFPVSLVESCTALRGIQVFSLDHGFSEGLLHCSGPGIALVVRLTPPAARALDVMGEATPVRMTTYPETGLVNFSALSAVMKRSVAGVHAA